jgi:hypothetical protein
LFREYRWNREIGLYVEREWFEGGIVLTEVIL